MPQMKPMNWIILFLMLNLMLMMMNIKMFFYKNTNFKKNNKMIYNKNLKNWKW